MYLLSGCFRFFSVCQLGLPLSFLWLNKPKTLRVYYCSPAAREWTCLYLCLGCYTPVVRGAWSFVGRCVDCGMRRRGRSAAAERVDPPVGSLFRLRGGDCFGPAVC